MFVDIHAFPCLSSVHLPSSRPPFYYPLCHVVSFLFTLLWGWGWLTGWLADWMDEVEAKAGWARQAGRQFEGGSMDEIRILCIKRSAVARHEPPYASDRAPRSSKRDSNLKTKEK